MELVQYYLNKDYFSFVLMSLDSVFSNIKDSVSGKKVSFKRYIFNFFNSIMIKNGIYIFLSIFISSPLDFIFWLLAARYYLPEVVGTNMSVIGLITLVSLLSRFGLENGLKGSSPKNPIKVLLT